GEANERYIQWNKNSSISICRCACYRLLNVRKCVDFGSCSLDTERAGPIFKRTGEGGSGRIVGIVDHGDMSEMWGYLLQCLQLLADDRKFHDGEAGDVATGASETFHVASRHGFSATGNYDWNRLRQLHQDRDDASANGDDDIGLQFHEVRGSGSDEVHVVDGP